ncbi:MAG: DUF1987 domain-containing protein [Cytophagales bacterium]|nr:DUF1987 domain-containing protein [Cytophagales bacterium]
MENLQIEKTYRTPAVSLDAQKGLLEIKGMSIPGNTKEFYLPIMKWIEQYCQHPKNKTVVIMQFVLYNTATAKYIMDMLKSFEALYKKGFDIKVKWQYEQDDESCELDGKDYAEWLEVPIEVVEV